MATVSYMLDDSAVTSRGTEVPDASFTNGVNAAASNASGIGINFGVAGLVGGAQQFTLLDQHAAARTPQESQVIGGLGYTDPAGWPSSGGVEGTLPNDALRFGDPSVSGDGVVTGIGNVHLVSLAAGWVAV